MRYSISDDVSFQEATPRGILAASFRAGEVEPGDDSDERFIIETRLIPAGIAERVGKADNYSPGALPAQAEEPESEAPAAPAASPDASPDAPPAIAPASDVSPDAPPAQ